MQGSQIFMWVAVHLAIGFALIAIYILFKERRDLAENELSPYCRGSHQPATHFTPGKYSPWIALGLLAGSILPDTDVIMGFGWAVLNRLPSEAVANSFHHTFTHSLVFLSIIFFLLLTAFFVLLTSVRRVDLIKPVVGIAAASTTAAMVHGLADLLWLDPVAIFWPLGGFYHYGLSFTDEPLRVVIMNVDLLLTALLLFTFVRLYGHSLSVRVPMVDPARLARWNKYAAALYNLLPKGDLSKMIRIGCYVLAFLNLAAFVFFVVSVPEYLAGNSAVRYANYAALILAIGELLLLSVLYSFQVFPAPFRARPEQSFSEAYPEKIAG